MRLYEEIGSYFKNVYVLLIEICFFKFVVFISDVLRNDKKFNATPDHEISTVAAKWLAQATNRVTKKKKIV